MAVNTGIIVAYNNRNLTEKTVVSMRNQDVPVKILVVENHSQDGTVGWLATQPDLHVMYMQQTEPLSHCWNTGLKWVFRYGGATHALVCNNDIEILPFTYRFLLASGDGFVTPVGMNDREKVFRKRPKRWKPDAKRPHPDFSCFLIRRQVFRQVGDFDEGYEGAYVEDCDYHLRMHKAGVVAVSINLPYYHVASAVLKDASEKDAKRIRGYHTINMERFTKKWGVRPSTPEYYALFNSPEGDTSGQIN